MAAIELSRIVLEKAMSPEIKSFAQLIIGGYAVAGDKLKSENPMKKRSTN